MAPMRSHIFDQFKRIHTNRKVSFWYGARSLREAFYIDRLRLDCRRKRELRLAPRTVRATGRRQLGRASPASSTRSSTTTISRITRRPKTASTDICGPPMMNDAVIQMLTDLGVERENVMFDDFG